MKYVVILLVGFVAGAMLALFAANLLARQDATGKALMVLMQEHLGALRTGIRGGQCAADATRARLERLVVLTAEIDYAFPTGLADDPAFGVRRDELARVLDGLSADVPADCAKLSNAIKSIADTCDACHNAHRY
jgi:cytochrome c556